MAPPSRRGEYRRRYQRQYRRRIGKGDGSSRTLSEVGGEPRGLGELFAALGDLQTSGQIRVRRAALKAMANHLTKVAKRHASDFDIAPHARATLRRAIFRKDPTVVERPGKRGKARRVKPMRYVVGVRRGKGEQKGAVIGKAKDGSDRVLEHSRDAWWWAIFEKGTDTRRSKRGWLRGKIWGQHIFARAFSDNANAAIAAGESAGYVALNKELQKLEAKAKKNPESVQ